MRDEVELLECVVCLDGCTPIPKRIVRQEDETYCSHLFVAPDLIVGNYPFRLRRHVCAVEDVIFKLDGLLVQLGDNEDLLLFHNS